MIRLFDGHSDIFEDVDEKHARGLDHILRDNHLWRWEKGGCVGGFCPIWVDAYQEVYPMPVKEQSERIIKHMLMDISECSDSVEVVKNSSEYFAAIDSGKHALFLGTEGLSFLHGDVAGLDRLYDMGGRIFSLTWNEDNEFAAGASSSEGTGLTEAGKDCVRRIHQLGAILDLAHTHRSSFYDAVELTEGPFVVSHGNIDALCNHPRNLTDDQMRIVAEHNGVFGISAYPPFISDKKEEQNIERFCDNIDYAVKVMGVDHVGLGFDFVEFLDDFGIDPTISDEVAGLEGIKSAQNVAECLRQRGYSEEDINKICHDNFLRVVGDILG